MACPIGMCSLPASNIPAVLRYGGLGVEESVGIETVAFPPEMIAGDRSLSVFAATFGVTPI